MRLTKAIRSEILNTVMKKRMKKVDEELEVLKSKVGDALFSKLFEQAPKGLKLTGWANATSAVGVRIYTEHVKNDHVLSYPLIDTPTWVKYFSFNLSKSQFISIQDKYRDTLDFDECISIPEFKAWFEALEKAYNLRKEIYDEVSLLLGSATTAKKLIEIWPEVEPYLPVSISRAGALVPVGKVRKVNKLLELP